MTDTRPTSHPNFPSPSRSSFAGKSKPRNIFPTDWHPSLLQAVFKNSSANQDESSVRHANGLMDLQHPTAERREAVTGPASTTVATTTTTETGTITKSDTYKLQYTTAKNQSGYTTPISSHITDQARPITNPHVPPPSSSLYINPHPSSIMDAAAPPTPPTTPVKTRPGKAFVVRPSPTGGMGAFATRPLTPGEVLLEETPLLVAQRERLFAVFATLRRKKQQKAFKLHASDHFKPGTEWLEAIWDTNSFSTGRHREAGLFPIAARFNHACTGGDNVHYRYDASRRRLCLWVAAEVVEGEELKLCYGRGKTPALLYHWYGFQCACGACEGLSEQDMDRFAVKW